jgi:hypothetical protein
VDTRITREGPVITQEQKLELLMGFMARVMWCNQQDDIKQSRQAMHADIVTTTPIASEVAHIVVGYVR